MTYDTKPSPQSETYDSETTARLTWALAHRTWTNSHFTWASSGANFGYDTEGSGSYTYETKP